MFEVLLKDQAHHRKTMNERDRRGIVFCAEQKAVPLDLLGQLFAPDLSPALTRAAATSAADAGTKKRGGPRRSWPADLEHRLHTTRQIVCDWAAWGYARLYRPFYHQPLWVMITARGMQAFGLRDYKEIPFPDLDDLDHLRQITRVRLELARASKVPKHVWISERSLAAELPEAHPGIGQPHLADGALQLQSGNRIAVEVELSIKTDAELDRIFHALISQYSAVWYFCNSTTFDKIMEVRATFPDDARRKITVFRLEDTFS